MGMSDRAHLLWTVTVSLCVLSAIRCCDSLDERSKASRQVDACIEIVHKEAQKILLEQRLQKPTIQSELDKSQLPEAKGQ